MGVLNPQSTSAVQPERYRPPLSNDRDAEKQAKRQEKTLKSFGPLLKHHLDADETVLLATRACSPITAGEYLTTGWILYIVKRCVLIFTNKRILHVPTTQGFAPRGSVGEIPYSVIAEAKVGRFLGRTLKLRYRSGKTETFQQFPSFEHKQLRNLLPSLPIGQGVAASGERRSLCPRCKRMLAKKQFDCSGCRLEFKNRKKAALLSVLLPGGGYFYTRHWIMGVLDAIVETYLLLFVLAMLAVAVTSTGDDAMGALAAAILIGFFLFIEKLVTVSHAFHFVDEFIPVPKDVHAAPAPLGTPPTLSPAR